MTILPADCYSFIHESNLPETLIQFSLFQLGHIGQWSTNNLTLLHVLSEVEYIGQKGTIGSGHLIHTNQGHSSVELPHTSTMSSVCTHSNIKVTSCTLTSGNYKINQFKNTKSKKNPMVIALFIVYSFHLNAKRQSIGECSKLSLKLRFPSREGIGTINGEQFHVTSLRQ